MNWPPQYPKELISELEHEALSLADDKKLYDTTRNGPSQQGTPKIRVYRGVYLWHTQSIAATKKAAILSTFIDQDRVERIQRLGVLRRYPVLPYPGSCTSIDYVFTGKNYYHYLVDSLPRLWSLKHPTLMRQPKPLVVLDPSVPKRFREFSKLVFPHLRFRTVPRFFRILPKQYIHLPYLSKDRVGFSTADTQTSGGFIPNEFLDFLRKAVQQRLSSADQSYPDKIYIKRGLATVRKVTNEANVEKTLSSMGFVSVDLSKLGLLEQAKLFLKAKAIVGPHGAGFANLLYCTPESTKVFEIYPSRVNARHYYSLYCHAMNMPYFPAYLDEEDISSDFEIPKSFIELVGDHA